MKARFATLIRPALLVASLGVALASASLSSESPGSRAPLPLDEAGLRWYLSRAITAGDILAGTGSEKANIAFFARSGARFIGRAIAIWGWESTLPAKLAKAKRSATVYHAAEPDLLFQGCLFEAVTTDVESLKVPTWAFEAFGIKPERRNFRYSDMLFPAGQTVGYNQWSEFSPTDHWGKGSSIPDIRRVETKLWYYYLGRSFIDAGCEALHLGQIGFMRYRDPGNAHYTKLLGLLRDYAARGARRGFVLFDGSAMGYDCQGSDGRLLFDFGSSFTGMTERAPYPKAEILPSDKIGTPYGQSPSGRNRSGITFSRLPYLVELDNWGVDTKTGEPTLDNPSVYGYDEITWFSNLGPRERDEWLAYEAARVRELDPVAFFQYPFLRELSGNRDGIESYYALDPSAEVKDGFGQETVITALLSRYATSR